MRFLTLKEILILHNKLIDSSGGSKGIRDFNTLKSALAQPFMTFNGNYFYKSIIDKAVVLGFSLIMNHPFIDGNKRIGHATMETFLYLNGYEINAPQVEQKKVILNLAAGKLNREQFSKWVNNHIVKLK